MPEPVTFNPEQRRRNESTPPQIPDHELLRRIGAGSYGEVWIARNVFGEHRAVKIVYRSTFEDDRPFEREFEGIRRFEPISRSHPSQLNILHVGRGEGCFYYVMELADPVFSNQYSVTGNSIADASTGSLHTDSLITDYSPRTLKMELKRRGRLPPAECVEIGLALTTALAHLHARGLVHRDVKPSNVIFVGGVAKLADIGLVAAVSDSRSYVGTEGYIPPEGPGAPSADCYALGKLLYELSTGHDRTAWPEPPAGLPTRPDCERLLELNAILHKACAPNARERYQNADALQADLEWLQRGQSVRRKRFVGRSLALAAKILFGASVTALVVIGGNVLRTTRISVAEKPQVGARQSAENPEATKLCKLARFHYYKITEEGFAKAMDCFNQALEIDAKCVSAYAGIADLCVVSQPSHFLLPKSAEAKMRWARDKLAAVDSELAEGHAVQGFIDLVYDWNPGKAERELERALKLDPELLIAHIWRAKLFVYTRRFSEAEQDYRRAQQLDPTRYGLNVNAALVPFFARRYENAIAQFEKAAELMPHKAWALWMIGRANEEMGKYAEAIDALQKAELLTGAKTEGAKQKCDELRNAFEHSGQDGYWRKKLAWALNENGGALDKAQIHAHLREVPMALDQLDKAFQEKSEYLLWLNVDPAWDSIRSEPRFLALLKKMGLGKGD